MVSYASAALTDTGRDHLPRSASVLFFMSFCRRLVCSSSLKSKEQVDTHPHSTKASTLLCLRQGQQGEISSLCSRPLQALQEADHPKPVH